MSPAVEEQLQAILRAHGVGLLDDARRLEALLRDKCPRHKRDVFSLLGALKARVPQELQSTGTRLPWEVLQARLVGKILDELPISEEVARESVAAWARALGHHVPETSAPTSSAAAAPATAPVYPWQWHDGAVATD